MKNSVNFEVEYYVFLSLNPRFLYIFQRHESLCP